VAVLRERGQERRRKAEEAKSAFQYASELRVAADQAAAGAQRWQQAWEQSETELDAAWQAWLDADARVRRATAAAAWGTPRSVRGAPGGGCDPARSPPPAGASCPAPPPGGPPAAPGPPRPWRPPSRAATAGTPACTRWTRSW